ncbi:MAG TPA: hypothetical protein VJ276_01840 [Thermoanaerobaculia bacterium]|nr:hypothetical protein [Thermoanaerobaculia bacterium]
MRIIVLALSISLTTAVLAADQPDVSPATFCQGQYALCIKAACSPIVSRNSDGTYAVQEANCVCDVLTGWSMGPGACDTRTPTTVSGRTYLTSSYSNFFNKTNLTLSCPSTDTVWAQCYGAPCTIDLKNPKKAVCTCPVKTGAMMTLGGGCRSGACNSIWSAATPSGNKFANDYFYKYMTENDLQPPPNPPAKKCLE